MKIIFTKDPTWLQKWDDFVLQQKVANHLLLSAWNQSFESYGFDYEIALLIEDDQIIGGFAAVIAKAAFFKFYIVPFGPITAHNKTEHWNDLIVQVPERAKQLGCCYAHISLPFSASSNPHVCPEIKFSALATATEGHRFKYVYSAYGINWKSVQGFETEEDFINSFKASVRRYIRSAQRKELELRFLQDENEVKNAYNLCLENADNHGYALRSWSAFKDTLLQMIHQNQAHFMGAFFEGNIKGAALIVKAGNHYTYILGGTKKEKPDFLAGHFLHFEAMRLAYREKLSGYNISLGGSKGVISLKSSYADEQVYFENGKYHWVLRPTYFKLYLFFEKYLKKYKKSIAKGLALLKR
ncbi:MAG: peptidoglycan bridge formation glycyltransferase FemA/FemB family protein [Flavobacterium sp.]|nr:peptidoglycan bridge formation glycyltransferase FemA/FemB family protein [Flavobacterium sp.]MBP8156858.1 peptidoglycan bridge formation glycyltransferase FemA/FemB family protein [Flavobacterium sp.]